MTVDRDAVFMVEANASMYPGSPRMSETVIGEPVPLEERGVHEVLDALVDSADEDDVDALRVASELVIDAIVQPEGLREELVARFAAARDKRRDEPERRHGVAPV